MKNTFPYSDDNKRYHTYNYYLRHTYGCKVFKVPLDAGFTCPNRDGTCGTGGCIYCPPSGSGEFTRPDQKDLIKQYHLGKEMMERKWPEGKTIPYFQSFSNTYGPLSRIKECVEPFLTLSEVQAIAIATRADCLSEEVIQYLDSLTCKKDIWIELGLQSSNDTTAAFIHRGHSFAIFSSIVQRLKQTSIKVCVHIINGLLHETEKEMLQTVHDVNVLNIDAIKIHMLSVVKDTQLATFFDEHPFHLLDKEEYIDIVIKQLELLNPSIIIERLTGDPLKENLIAPLWLTNKTVVLNDIDKKMRALDTYQGKKI